MSEEINTCKNCKWWGRWGDKKCAKVGKETLMVGLNKSFKINAQADDNFNLRAYLITGPDFGCVQFEFKTEGN